MRLFWVASGKWFRQALAAKLTEDRQILYGASTTWSERVQKQPQFSVFRDRETVLCLLA
jgi:hypothetical protein